MTKFLLLVLGLTVSAVAMEKITDNITENESPNTQFTKADVAPEIQKEWHKASLSLINKLPKFTIPGLIQEIYNHLSSKDLNDRKLGANALRDFTLQPEKIGTLNLRYMIAKEIFLLSKKTGDFKTIENSMPFSSVEEWKISSLKSLPQYLLKNEFPPFLYQVTTEKGQIFYIVGSRHDVILKFLHPLVWEKFLECKVFIKEIPTQEPILINDSLYQGPLPKANNDNLKKSFFTKDILYNTPKSISKGEDWLDLLSPDSKNFIDKFIQGYIQKTLNVKTLKEVSPLSILYCLETLVNVVRSSSPEAKGMDNLLSLLAPQTDSLESEEIRFGLKLYGGHYNTSGNNPQALQTTFAMVENGLSAKYHSSIKSEFKKILEFETIEDLPQAIKEIEDSIMSLSKEPQGFSHEDIFSPQSFLPDFTQKDFLEAILNLFGAENVEYFTDFIQDDESDGLKKINPPQTETAYLRGDAQAILGEHQCSGPDSYLMLRNLYWSSRSIPKLVEKYSNQEKIMLMMGVAHLYGEYGILRLLSKEKGYTIRRYNADGTLGTAEEIEKEINLRSAEESGSEE